MPGYFITGPAQRDLGDIEHYYTSIANESVARRQLALLYYRFDLLGEYPYIGWSLEIHVPRLRRYTVPRAPFVILYYTRDDYVEIARVIHGIQHLDRAIQ